MLLYRLKLGEEVCTIPTIGFNIETIEYRGWKVDMWDIGGESFQPLLEDHFKFIINVARLRSDPASDTALHPR